MTNLERIQKMTVEEMAEILFSSCTESIENNELCYDSNDKKCVQCVTNWLNSECEVSNE